MILFERAATAAVRPGEWEIAGRRAAARLLPYVGDVRGSLRFDPLELRFRPPRAEARVLAGPSDASAWSEQIRGLPRGPLLIGPGVEEGPEAVHGSYGAAIAGAAALGLGAYLLDPPRGVAGLSASPAGLQIVVVSWSPSEDWEIALADVAATGVAAGVVLPLIPGWTAAETELTQIVERAAGAGASFVAGVFPADDGDARRLTVEARAQQDPKAADELFELLHHRGGLRELPDAARRLAEQAGRRGLSPLPSRPRASGEAAGNAAAADALEHRALENALQEHLSASFLAAARWVDECGRDLSAIAREGNFRRVFPFDGEVAAAAEAALGVSR